MAPTRLRTSENLLVQVPIECYTFIEVCSRCISNQLQKSVSMDKERLEYFKDLLTKRREGLVAEASQTIVEMSDDEETFPDPTDRASLETDRNFLLRIRDRERKLILKIDEALERIEDTTFGICELCGEDISDERLKARPVTTLCIDCKTDSEEKEKIGS